MENIEKLYRYIVPDDIEYKDIKFALRPWLNNNYGVYLTEKGKENFEKIFKIGEDYPDIKLEIINKNDLLKIIWDDDYQIVG